MQGKVVLVTGGSSGTGRAIAIICAQRRAKVVVAARGAERGAAVAREIEAGDGTAVFVAADVSQSAK